MARTKKVQLPPGRHVVVITRHWKNPEIKISVTDNLIAIAMTLPEFLTSLALELGDPEIEAKLTAAAVRVTEKMKAETVRVM